MLDATFFSNQIQSRGQEDPLEKEMATHSSVLAWELLGNLLDRESWRATDHEVANESDMT